MNELEALLALVGLCILFVGGGLLLSYLVWRYALPWDEDAKIWWRSKEDRHKHAGE